MTLASTIRLPNVVISVKLKSDIIVKEASMEHMFDDILERDEKIVKVFKPNKKRIKRGEYYRFLLFCLFPFWGWAAFILHIVFFPIPIWVLSKNYNNRFYCYTNKRILIRKGLIGTDYKSLEYKNITATTVNVGFLDKALKTNTGRIEFGSPASPIGRGGQGVPKNPYVFDCIEKPYDILREVKEYMDKKI